VVAGLTKLKYKVADDEALRIVTYELGAFSVTVVEVAAIGPFTLVLNAAVVPLCPTMATGNPFVASTGLALSIPHNPVAKLLGINNPLC
jgi:hypothetical protein